jgi:hypothetical protein
MSTAIIEQNISNDIFALHTIHTIDHNSSDKDDNHKHHKTGHILCITDPHGANIYLDGILQPETTSALITNVKVGKHVISFTKAGYKSYTKNIIVKRNRITKICAILSKIADIIDKGIVICQTSDISSCPTSPVKCPIPVTPLDYTNLIAIINSTSNIDTTVRFIYSINGNIDTVDISVNLMEGINIIYAWASNIRHPANTILTLEDVTLS